MAAVILMISHALSMSYFQATCQKILRRGVVRPTRGDVLSNDERLLWTCFHAVFLLLMMLIIRL